jgi:hypothetical protein
MHKGRADGRTRFLCCMGTRCAATKAITTYMVAAATAMDTKPLGGQ